MPVPAGADDLLAPAPECPQRQGPGRPAEPQQQPRQALPLLAAGARTHNPPAPQTEPPRKQGGHAGHASDGKRPAPAVVGVTAGRPYHHRHAAQPQQRRQRGRPCQCQPRQSCNEREGRRHGAMGHGRHRKEHQGCATELHHIARGLMRELREAQAGNQRQQAAIGYRAGIVGGRGFAPEGEGHRLGARAARKVVNAIPGGRQGDDQQECERQADRNVGGDPVGRQLDGPGAQPVRQEPFGVGGHAAKQRAQPGGAAMGQLQHVPERRDIGTLPRVTPYIAGNDIRDAQQNQGPARQGADSALGNDGGSG